MYILCLGYTVRGVAYSDAVELKVPIACVVFVGDKEFHARVFVYMFEVVCMYGTQPFSLDMELHIQHLACMGCGERHLWLGGVCLPPVDGVDMSRDRSLG